MPFEEKKESEGQVENCLKVIRALWKFIQNNPYPLCSQIKELAATLEVDPSLVNRCAYAMLSSIIAYGKSKGTDREQGSEFDESQIREGIKVEMEHLDADEKDPRIREINFYLAEKIAFDHLAESKEYYIPYLRDMEKEMKKEVTKKAQALQEEIVRKVQADGYFVKVMEIVEAGELDRMSESVLYHKWDYKGERVVLTVEKGFWRLYYVPRSKELILVGSLDPSNLLNVDLVGIVLEEIGVNEIKGIAD